MQGPYRGWRRRDGPKRSFKEWRADPAESIHRPSAIRTNIVYSKKDMPLLTTSDVVENTRQNDVVPVSGRKRALSPTELGADGVSRNGKKRRAASH